VVLLFTQRMIDGADDAALGAEAARHAFGDRT
jgi:hypothetical protein